jgi:hypothetical protein
MTDTTSPTDSRPLLLRASDLASPIIEADLGNSNLYAELLIDSADPMRVMAHAFWDVSDRLFQFYKPIAEVSVAYRCGWCIKAAGNTKQAWDAAQVMTLDEVQAHTLVCDYNPMVAAIRATIAAHDNCRYLYGPTPALSEALESLRALVTPVAPGPEAA